MKYPKGYIAKTLRSRRLALGLTQRELAGRLGMTQNNVSRIESGKRDPNWSTVLEVARALDLEPMFIPRDKVRAVQAAVDYDASREARDDEDSLIPGAEG